MRLLLARHAETGEQYQGRYIGATDLPISDKGIGQAEDLASRLEKYHPRRCISSPMLRTRQTSDIQCSRLNIECEYENNLVEINFGEWEGMTFSEIAQRYSKEVKNWSTEGIDFQFPAGEKNSDFFKRIKYAATRFRLEDDTPLLIVSHGGVIRAMICYFLGLSFDSYLLFNVKPARFAVLDVFDQGGVLSGFNL